MANAFRIGVLGMTHDHLWGELPDLAGAGAQLVAAADPDDRLLERARNEHGCPTYRDPRELLDAHALDAVYVFSDNATSVALAELALDRGLHVMIEKPMASTLAGADRLLAAAARSGKVLMINWPFAWWPQMQHALRLAGEGAIGRLWQVKYRAAHMGPREHGCSEQFCRWLYDEALNGGGAYADYTGYGCVLARALLGRPAEVFGWRGRLVKTDIDVDDNGVVMMLYPDAMAVSEGSWTQVDDMTSYRPHLYGADGTLLFEPYRGGRMWLATKERPQGDALTPPEPPPHLQNATAHFLHAIATGSKLFSLCDPAICRDAQEIMEAGLRSSRSGARIPLPLDPTGG